MIRLSFGLESSSGSPDISVRMGKDVTAESSELEALQPAFPKFGRVYTNYAIHADGTHGH
jgi:hypothetical protein